MTLMPTKGNRRRLVVLLSIAAGLAVAMWFGRREVRPARGSAPDVRSPLPWDDLKPGDLTPGDIELVLRGADMDAVLRCANHVCHKPKALAKWTPQQRADCGSLVLHSICEHKLPGLVEGMWFQALSVGGMLAESDVPGLLGEAMWTDRFVYEGQVLRLVAEIWQRCGRVTYGESAMRRCTQAADDWVSILVAVPVCFEEMRAGREHGIVVDARAVLRNAIDSLDERAHLHVAIEMLKWKCIPFEREEQEALVKDWLQKRFVMAMAAVAVADDSEAMDWLYRQVVRRVAESGGDIGLDVARTVRYCREHEQGEPVDWHGALESFSHLLDHERETQLWYVAAVMASTLMASHDGADIACWQRTRERLTESRD